MKLSRVLRRHRTASTWMRRTSMARMVSAARPRALKNEFSEWPVFDSRSNLPAVGILFGLIGLAAFAVPYAAASSRTGWVAALASATPAFFAFSVVARRLGSDVAIAGLADWLVLVLTASLIGRPKHEIARVAPPWWDLWVRMLAVGALTLAITAAAARLGPVLSGIVGTHPVAITVVLTFTHAQLCRDAALAMLRGNVLSWISFASCFLAIGLSLDALGIAPAIGLGVLAAIATSVLVLWTDRRVSASRADSSLGA